MFFNVNFGFNGDLVIFVYLNEYNVVSFVGLGDLVGGYGNFLEGGNFVEGFGDFFLKVFGDGFNFSLLVEGG